MSEAPCCPNCNRPFIPLSAHDRQALALAGNFPWVCFGCSSLCDDSGTIWPIESVKEQERSHFLAIIQTLRTVETPKTLQEIGEGLRAALATTSQVRYAWADVAPGMLRELWGVVDKIGGPGPSRPVALMDKPAVSEPYIQAVLQAVGDVVNWCGSRTLEQPEISNGENETLPDGPEGGRWLRWQGKRYDVPQGTVYRLLDFMWDREFAGYDTLFDTEVFEKAIEPGTIRGYLTKLKNALPCGFPWRLSANAVGRFITKKPALPDKIKAKKKKSRKSS